MATQTPARAPLSDAIVVAISRMVDDSQTETREPSHSSIESAMQRANLIHADPNREGRPVGKAKRVRGVLTWALENDPARGEAFVAHLLAVVRGCGGFREQSPNYVGQDIVQDITEAFRAEGYQFFADGGFQPTVLDNLAGKDLTAALLAYVRRAKRGAEDAALLAGTSKDLLEATAAHVIAEKSGGAATTHNFPTLLAQAFFTLGLATPGTKPDPAEAVQRSVERSLFELACAINRLRNKQGTGHGRPFLPTLKPSEARAAVESMGMIAEYLLTKMRE
jgi:hypothetical protein